MGDFEVLGSDQLKIVGAKLKVADKSLRLKMGRNIRAATAPLKSELPESARSTLPKTGGLAETVAASKVSTRITNTAQGIGVRVTTSNPESIRGMDRGRLRHPVFGNREVWVSQAVKPEWWTKPVEKLRGPVSLAAQAAVEETAKELEII